MTDKEAMKLALFALDIVKIHFTQSRHVNEAIAALKEQLAQSEQEPVAYINVEKRTLEWAKLTSWETPTVVNLPKIPLYTRPPPRTWVGLTQKEVQEIHDTFFKRMGPQEFASMIEAKLKEKNA